MDAHAIQSPFAELQNYYNYFIIICIVEEKLVGSRWYIVRNSSQDILVRVTAR